MPAMTYVVLANSINAAPMTKGETIFVLAFLAVALVVISAMIYDFHKNF